jgi:predicted MFS family arabinose efflux permease
LLSIGPYRPLLAEPGFRHQALSGFLAQLTQGGAGLAVILLIQQNRGSLALAGVATAGFVAGAGIARPIQGRLIDRRGPAAVLVGVAILHTAALLALVPLARSDVPGAVLVATALAAGLGLPPVSQTQRLAWGELAGEDRTAAYSMVTLIQWAAVLAGPLLVGVLVATGSPSLALIALTAVSGLGTLWLASSVDARPAEESRPTARELLRAPGMSLVLGVELLFGIALGAVEIGVPALATAQGEPAASGILYALASVGGLAGALAYGGRRWRAAPSSRLLILLALSSIGFVPLALTEDLVLAGALLLLVGVPLNPTLTTLSVMVDEFAPRSAAEAFGWASTSGAMGSGAGAALTGALADAHGSGSAFATAAVACTGALLFALLWGGRARKPPRLAARPVGR